MARGISEAAKIAASAGVVYPALFVELDFDSGPWRTWSGIGEITVGGEVYTVTGHLISIELPTESADLTANPIRATVSSVPTDLLALALAEPYQGRVVTIRQGFFTKEGQLVGEPDVWTRGRLDVMEAREGEETATLEISAETKLRDLRRSMGLLYTPEDQEALFPGDKFFEFVPTIRDVQVYWGDQDVD